MTEVVSFIVHDVLGSRIQDVDQPIVDCIVNILAEEDFDFGVDGDGAFEAVSELLFGAECVSDFEECRLVCSKITERFGKHGLVKAKATFRSLATPFHMDDRMDEEVVPKKKQEVFDCPVLSERDRQKIERRKRKDERQREAQYQMHLAEMEAVRAGMPAVCVNHDTAFRDIKLENFNISVGGRDLIVDGSVTLSFGRHYGVFDFFLTALLGEMELVKQLSSDAIEGIPRNCQILHVVQEVAGDDTSA